LEASGFNNRLLFGKVGVSLLEYPSDFSPTKQAARGRPVSPTTEYWKPELSNCPPYAVSQRGNFADA
jgi:hypothetical protein